MCVGLADMSGNEVHWLPDDPKVRGTEDPSAPVRIRSERSAGRSTAESDPAADQRPERPDYDNRQRIKGSLSSCPQKILR